MSDIQAENDEKPKRFFWKGKRVTEKVYKKRCLDQQLAKNLRNIYGTKRGTYNLKKEKLEKDENCQAVEKVLEGRRIVHLQTLGEQLFCKKCKCALSLLNIISEKHYGFASVFDVQCPQSKIVKKVATDKQHVSQTIRKVPENKETNISADEISNMRKSTMEAHEISTEDRTDYKCRTDKKRKYFVTNTKAVIGTLNGGIGSTHLNKLASSLNMPLMNWETYKRHEKEVGAAVESVAHDSCVQAAREERDLTIQNQDEMKKLLPSHLQDNFIFPDVNADVQSITKEHTVRVASSFDMGWITRGTGRTYDSLSGTGALIGHFSKKVISYITLNRKCRMCDMSHSPNDHDCRLNFQGSAKAMEPHAAVQLTNKNSILKEVKTEIGVLVADNDSSSIFAIRNASSHEVIKQSDKNHTSKGVVNMLYKIKNRYKELTAQSIKYLQRCFNFCISQNIGNDCNMATAIINIPEHCFNNHEKCGSWCKYETNQDTYKHSVINEGFKNQNLLLALREIFNTLAKKTSSFSAGASSNCNESLNSVIVSKAPKSRLYGTSSSGDIRVACAINQKNIGEQHVVHLDEKLTLSPGKYNEKLCLQKDAYSRKRYAKSLTRDFKKRRLFLRKDKTELRNKKEVSEGTTYESDIGLRNLDFESSYP
ncbi:uncharacterized protein [Prorops nasuta]|uniref:uncharacterized protein n=1 Tax=Prorops nasuta TaxID=863751 RepID=UPI0034CFC170